jgi:hypothetical protein
MTCPFRKAFILSNYPLFTMDVIALLCCVAHSLTSFRTHAKTPLDDMVLAGEVVLLWPGVGRAWLRKVTLFRLSQVIARQVFLPLFTKLFGGPFCKLRGLTDGYILRQYLDCKTPL